MTNIFYQQTDGSTLNEATPSHDTLAELARLRQQNKELRLQLNHHQATERVLAQRIEAMRALSQTSLEINNQHTLTELLQAILQRACALLHTKGGVISLVNYTDKCTDVVAKLPPVTDAALPTRQHLTEGISGCVLQTGSPKQVENYNQWSGRVQAIKIRVGRCIGVPLKLKSQIIGVLEMYDEQPGRFSELEIELLTMFATQAAVAIKNAQLLADAANRLRQQSVLQEVIAITADNSDLTVKLNQIAKWLTEILDITSVYFCLCDSSNETFTIISEHISPTANDAEKVSDLGCQYSLKQFPSMLKTLQTGKPFMTSLADDALCASEREHLMLYGGQTVVIIPLYVQGEMTAVVELWESRRERTFTAEEIELCEAVARHAAIVIKKDALQKTQLSHIKQTKQILDTVPIGIFLLDQQRYIKQANMTAKRYLHQIANVGVGDELSTLGEHDVGNLLQNSIQQAEQELTLTADEAIYTLSSRPVLGEMQGQLEWVMILREVTEERQTRQLLEQQSRLAAVGQLAAGIAHDFNNILTTIIGCSEIAMFDKQMQPETHAELQTVITSGEQAAHLIRQILDFSRQTVVEKKPIELVTFLTSSVNLFKRAIPETIGIDFQVELASQSYIIVGDVAQLQQMLTNLAINARDAMPLGGQLTIHLSITSSPPLTMPHTDREFALITISDTGQGICSDHLGRIFEPFFSTKPVGRGTGLGLSQVYGIVSQHDGYIDVKSQPNVGTKFYIYLPLISTEPSQVLSLPATIDVMGQGQTILLVEDDPVVLRVYQMMVEGLGYRTLVATNGEEALQLYNIHQSTIDVVLTDITMPTMDGLQLAKALQQFSPPPKIVVTSGYAFEGTPQTLAHLGVSVWLPKPVRLQQLVQAFRHRSGKNLQSQEKQRMTVKTAGEMVAAAKAQIENLSVEQVAAELAQGDTLVVDIREPAEQQQTGVIAGSIQVPRGMLEFVADPSSPYHKEEFDPNKRVILHCASGGRSALAGATLKEMGYTDVAHLETGMKGWQEAGQPTESVG